MKQDEYRAQRSAQIDSVFMHMAEDIASLSHGRRAKVGAILVSGSNILAYGYNGTPTGFDNNAEDEIDGKLVTKPETMHAESNAIAKVAKSTQSSDGSTMYVTLCPCLECSKLMIQAGIKRLIYKESYRDTSGIDLLKKCGVLVEQI